MLFQASFDKAALAYEQNSFMQLSIAKNLISNMHHKYDKVLDLGCGSGYVYKSLKYKPNVFIGIDISSNMLKVHPKGNNIKLLNCSFEEDFIYKSKYDMIIASSSLQWASNISQTINKIACSSKNIAFAIFTDNTLQEIYKHSNIKSFLPCKDFLINYISKIFKINYYIKNFTFDFSSTKEALLFIKNSGMNAKGRFGLKDIRYLLSKDIKMLNFEVFFCVGTSLKSNKC